MKHLAFLVMLAGACASSTAAPREISVNDAPLTQQLRLFPQEKIYLATDRDDYIAGDTVFLRAHCIDATTMRPAMASRYVYVELLPSAGGEALQRVEIRSDDGLYAGYLQLPDTMAGGDYTLAAYTRYQLNQDEDYLFRKAIRVSTGTLPKPEPQSATADFDVSFFPEGGYLIPGRSCRVAFKAMGSDGRGLAVRGVVRDDRGREVAPFRSRHAGMGSFEFTSAPGRSYTAECTDAQGRMKKVPLPAADPDAYVVRINDLDSLIEVLPFGARPLPAGLQLLVHCRGIQCYLAPWNPQSSRLMFRKRDLPGGLLQVLLLRNESEILSERLFFNPGSVLANTDVQPRQQVVAKRSPVVLDVDVKDESGKALAGDFSVSVIDCQSVPVSSAADIYAVLMLTSELRGTIEDANYYFDPQHDDRQEALDELLLTQGWRRYDIPAVLKGDFRKPEIPVEKGRSLAGRVVKKGGGSLGLYVLQATAPAYGFSKTVAVAEDGYFLIEGIELPDKAEVRLSVLYADNPAQDVMIELDTVRYASLTRRIPCTFPANGADVAEGLARQSALSRLQASLADSVQTVETTPPAEEPEQTAEPEKVPVQSEKKRSKRDRARVWDATAIREMGAYSVEDLISRLPGIIVSEGLAMYRQRPIAFAVNGVIETTPDQIAVTSKGMLGELDERPGTKTIYSGTTYGDSSTALADQRLLSGSQRITNIPERILVYPIEVVKQVELIQPGNTLQWGPDAVNGLVHFTIDHMMVAQPAQVTVPAAATAPVSGMTIDLSGYQRPAEFYAPAYPTDESREAARPDYRMTLYWNPSVRLFGGRAQVEFYASDAPARYFLSIEGVTTNGHIIRERRMLDLEAK